MATIGRYQNGSWVDAFTTAPLVASTLKASFGYTKNQLSVSLNGSASTPSAGASITDYQWDFGDSTAFGHGASVSHTYNSPGTYSVILQVTDSSGASVAQTQSIQVSSTVLDYIADTAPHFVQYVHPASGTSVAQCIIRSPDTGEWYMSQVHQESVSMFGNTESLRISRMAADGTLIDEMLCSYGGHGTSIGLEMRNGQIYVWATYFQPETNSTRTHDIVRFPYVAGTFSRAQIAGLQVMIPGGIYRRFQFDWKNGYFLLTEDPTWKRYLISDIQNSDISTPVNSVSVTVNPPTLQGLCTYGDSIFYYTGDGADTTSLAYASASGGFFMWEKSWKTGATIQRIDLTTLLADGSGNYPQGHCEPESCTLYDPGFGSDPTLQFGMITNLAGTAHTYYIYNFNLYSQAEAAANRTFELRETKPAVGNVGAGLLRPLTSVHNGDLTITQDNYVLKDTTVNGSVTIQAANVVIENCILRGPAVDPGATTVNPVFVVNTNNLAVVNGPALIRYSTIASRWKSPNVYGVGERNFTLEYCNISDVIEGARPTASTSGGDANAIIRGNYIHDLIFYCPDPNNPTPVAATNIAGQSLSGTWAGKDWNWASGIHLLGNASTGIEIYGNNIVANWANDSAYSTTPIPSAYARINALRITGGTALVIEDNWLDGGEECVYSPTFSTSGNVARNRFGRGMATTSVTSDSGYYALFVTGTTLVTNDASSVNRNLWSDTGSTVYHRAS